MTRIAGVVLLALTFVGATLMHPARTVLLFGLAFYAMGLWRFPAIAVPAVLALLPMLDFAQWTGWTLLNEFDCVLAVTLGVWLLRAREEGPPLSRSTRWLIGLVTASFVVSALSGLWPLAPLDANALYTQYTGWSSLRQLKGFASALAMLPVIREESSDPSGLERRFTAGMVLGLTGTVLVILWQRMVFTGLFDFGVVYRVEGFFPELRAGGGDVHAYLVTAAPFVFAWVAERPVSRRIIAGTALFVLATYAIGVTFTRGAYVGYAVAFLGLCVATVRYRSGAGDVRFVGAAALAVAAAIGVAVLAPIVSGAFMEARLTGTRAEASTRAHHWARTVDMMDKDLPTTLLGMGLGTFPRTFLVKHPDEASATFRYGHESDESYLRLGSGRPLYLDQRVAVEPGRTYLLSLDMRSSNPATRLDAMLCEKSIQYSFRCRTATLEQHALTAGWTHREAELASADIGSGSWLLKRPVVLTLTNPRLGTVVDVDNVRLLDDAGRDLLVNGDFARGGARWFSTADNHLPSHIFNLWVEILFEQGWLGVVAVGVLVAAALYRSAAGMWHGDLFAGAVLAALCGFLAVGMTESLLDGPRIATLFFLTIFLALQPRLSLPGFRGRESTDGH